VWQSGIHRDLFLYATDRVYLADVFARGSLRDDLREAHLELRCTLDAIGATPTAVTLEAQLYDPEGAPSLPLR